MSYGRSFQFIAAECLKQRDDETVRKFANWYVFAEKATT